jgi:hypothetical protein
MSLDDVRAKLKVGMQKARAVLELEREQTRIKKRFDKIEVLLRFLHGSPNKKEVALLNTLKVKLKEYEDKVVDCRATWRNIKFAQVNKKTKDAFLKATRDARMEMERAYIPYKEVKNEAYSLLKQVKDGKIKKASDDIFNMPLDDVGTTLGSLKSIGDGLRILINQFA